MTAEIIPFPSELAEQSEQEPVEAVQETKPEGWHYIARYYD